MLQIKIKDIFPLVYPNRTSSFETEAHRLVNIAHLYLQCPDIVAYRDSEDQIKKNQRGMK